DTCWTSGHAGTAFDETKRAREQEVALDEDALGQTDSARRVLIEEERRAVAGALEKEWSTAHAPRNRRAIPLVFGGVRLERRVSEGRAEVARIAHQRERRHGLEGDADPAKPVDRGGAAGRNFGADALRHGQPEGRRVHLHLGQPHVAIAGVLV